MLILSWAGTARLVRERTTGVQVWCFLARQQFRGDFGVKNEPGGTTGVTALAGRLQPGWQAREGTRKNYDQHRYQSQIETDLTLWRDGLVEIIGAPLVPGLPDNVMPVGRKAAMGGVGMEGEMAAVGQIWKT